ncbi:hypothetical protein CC78DRAFT_543463 [Lojkania enalia]|uniref:Glycosyltransferase family 34 protein n=1 Tax=Lojkania enalia TaxID=147567 RepID=A0A9P4K9D7_9PLEO|nr:hypothetical protein CC78DRAFT_543463 [Didymosphaeria enalia]
MTSLHSFWPALGQFKEGVLFTPVDLGATRRQENLRIAKASMLYGPTNSILEKAIESHVKHNERYGYEMHILRHPISKGFRNKYTWLKQIITNELQNSEEDRAEWIMYFDPSTVLLNPQIPLYAFLPPVHESLDPVTILATKPDGTTTSSSVFFIRVSQDSLGLLSDAMNAPGAGLDRDWGLDISSSTLQMILEQNDWKEKVIYQPAHWYNRPVTMNGGIAEGDLLARFPSELLGDRWKLMSDLITSLPTSHGKFSRSIENTIYATEPPKFWESLAGGKRDRRRRNESESLVERL